MKFSITIPAYKRKFLSEAIESCLAQSYKDFELIIVDDASPEDLESVVNSFKDPRIRYYRNEKNCGAVDVVDNWNKCLDYAQGDYIICMGDDDRLLPCCLEEYAKLMEKHPGLGVYHAWTEIIDENGKFTNITAARCEYESVYSLMWHRWNNRTQQYIGDFLFDTMQLRKNGGFYKLPLAWASDDITAVIAATSKGIANTQQLGFCYRVNSQTISNSGNAEIKMLSVIKEQEWYQSFLEKEPISETDKKYWECIRKMLPRYFEKKKGVTIANDLKSHSLLRLFYWIRNKKQYNLSRRCMLYSVIVAMKSIGTFHKG